MALNKKIGILLLLLAFFSLLLVGCSEEQEPDRPTRPQIPENSRREEDFHTDEQGWIHYPGAVQGVDVSDHQGEIDWARVRNAGVEFAILRIGFRGYTAGSLNLDETFEQNYYDARDAGLKLGVYFYSQATSRDEAKEEAEYVLQVLAERELDLPVFYDWEEVQSGRTAGYATSMVGDYALDFCQAVSKGGYRAGVYFNQRYGYSIMHLESLLDYDFWIAEYKSSQSFGFETAFWQYTGQGRVDGISTVVDLDLMYAPEDTDE